MKNFVKSGEAQTYKMWVILRQLTFESRVKSMINLSFIGYENYAITEDGEVFSFNNHKFKTLKESRGGYLRVFLSKNSKKKAFLVHRLVAKAYIPNPEGKPQVNHKDGNKKNNHISNLEWVTVEENLHHALDTGLRELQEFRVDRSLSDDLVHTICRMVGEGYRNIDIARSLGVDRHVIKNIKSGTQYKDIVSQYPFMKVVPTKRRVSTSKIKNICYDMNKGLRDEDICERNSITEDILENIRGGKFMPELVNKYLKDELKITVATTIKTTP